jgi:hypothetical protein
MNDQADLSEFLVISRGQWDKAASPQRIQTAIDDFYVWLERMVDEGKMKLGSRLGNAGKTVAKSGVSTTDGPFGESKEVVGGYWFVYAKDLEQAAQYASSSPTLECGLFYEIRPTDPNRCRAEEVTAETPK